MNFNTMFNLENETTPEAAPEKEVSTFDKVVTTAAKVGVIAGATVLTIAAVNSVIGEAAVGVSAAKTGFRSLKGSLNEKKDEKDSVKAKQMHAFTQKLRDEGYSDEEALELTKAEFGLK
jgi:hypothetical protein